MSPPHPVSCPSGRTPNISCSSAMTWRPMGRVGGTQMAQEATGRWERMTPNCPHGRPLGWFLTTTEGPWSLWLHRTWRQFLTGWVRLNVEATWCGSVTITCTIYQTVPSPGQSTVSTPSYYRWPTRNFELKCAFLKWSVCKNECSFVFVWQPYSNPLM